jgi:thiamine pyrophosphate-dependent acetolactate synthase large subunit-like protein
MLDALLAAQRPLIVAGGGAVLSGAWSEITRIAETLSIPVATTINGKGSINEMHAWSVGVIGGNGGRPYANQLLAEADCLFYLGTKVNSLVSLNGTIPCTCDNRSVWRSERVPCCIAGDRKQPHYHSARASMVYTEIGATCGTILDGGGRTNSV